jgi:hypothetical protein
MHDPHDEDTQSAIRDAGNDSPVTDTILPELTEARTLEGGINLYGYM